MTRRPKTILLVLVLAVFAPFVLTACSQAKAFASQCVFVIKSGWTDAHHLREILYPGERTNIGDDTARYIPCNARNYLVRPGSKDRDKPITVRLGAHGTNPGTPVNVWVDLYWTLNEDKAVLKEFLPFCEKYRCYSDGDQVSGDDNYSSPGWMGMLHENFDPSLDRSAIDVASKFDINLPNDQSSWPKLATAMQAAFMDEIKTSDGSPLDYFCGSGSGDVDVSGKVRACQAVHFSVSNVEYANADAQNLARQQATLQQEQTLAQQQAAVNKAKHDAAVQKYGPYTDYFTGLQDTIDHCSSNSNCTIVIGGNGSVSVPSGRK